MIFNKLLSPFFKNQKNLTNHQKNFKKMFTMFQAFTIGIPKNLNLGNFVSIYQYTEKKTQNLSAMYYTS